jgi:enoyl-CoA hydratase/carnithine racemase
LLTSDVLTAEQTLDLGLSVMVVPDDELDATGDRLVRGIAELEPAAVSFMLEHVDRATGRPPERLVPIALY